MLRVRRLSGHRPAATLISFLRATERAGLGTVSLDFENCSSVYPNGAAPSAAIIDLFRRRGLDIRCLNTPSLISRIGLAQPVIATKSNLRRQNNHWNTIWKYNDGDQIFALSEALIQDLIERIEFGPGVLEALSWCLYEILDNVLQHAQLEPGFIMLQYLQATRRLAVCISDAGLGIHRSFVQRGHYRPPLAKDALELAVSEWTSSTGERRGNGLYGLAEVVQSNDGTLDLRSGRGLLHRSGALRFSEQVNASDELFIDADHYCTVVDFHSACSTPYTSARSSAVHRYTTMRSNL